MNSNTPFLPVPKKFAIELLDALPSCGNTWFWLKGNDIQGRGVIEADIECIAADLEKSPGTIRNHIRAGLKLGLYWHVEPVSGTTYKFFLRSAIAVCHDFGISLSAQCTWIELKSDIIDRKKKATQCMAKTLQEQSRYKAYRKRRQKVQVDLEAEICNHRDSKGSSASARGKILWNGDRFLFLDESCVNYGGKQETIAERLGRCRSTIQRHLKGVYRKQVAIHRRDWTPERLTEMKRQLYWDEGLKKYFIHNGMVWEFFPNVYDINQTLVSPQRWNRRLRQYAKRYLTANTPAA